MCLEGKKKGLFDVAWRGSLGQTVYCATCSAHWTPREWDKLYGDQPTVTTMGGGSSEKHTIELEYLEGGRFQVLVDGKLGCLAVAVAQLAAAAGRYSETGKMPEPSVPLKAAYHHLGHVLRIAPAKPEAQETPAAETVEHLDSGGVRVDGITFAPTSGTMTGMRRIVSEYYCIDTLMGALVDRLKSCPKRVEFDVHDKKYLAERFGSGIQPPLTDATWHLGHAVAALSDASVARDSPLHALIEQ